MRSQTTITTWLLSLACADWFRKKSASYFSFLYNTMTMQTPEPVSRSAVFERPNLQSSLLDGARPYQPLPTTPVLLSRESPNGFAVVRYKFFCDDLRMFRTAVPLSALLPDLHAPQRGNISVIGDPNYTRFKRALLYLCWFSRIMAPVSHSNLKLQGDRNGIANSFNNSNFAAKPTTLVGRSVVPLFGKPTLTHPLMGSKKKGVIQAPSFDVNIITEQKVSNWQVLQEERWRLPKEQVVGRMIMAATSQICQKLAGDSPSGRCDMWFSFVELRNALVGENYKLGPHLSGSTVRRSVNSPPIPVPRNIAIIVRELNKELEERALNKKRFKKSLENLLKSANDNQETSNALNAALRKVNGNGIDGLYVIAKRAPESLKNLFKLAKSDQEILSDDIQWAQTLARQMSGLASYATTHRGPRGLECFSFLFARFRDKSTHNIYEYLATALAPAYQQERVTITRNGI